MSKYLPIILTVVAAVGAGVGLPGLVSAHPTVAMSLAAIAAVLHAALPSIFGVGSGS